MQVQPYLMFNGKCDEAIEFYRKALGADVKMLMRFKDSPEPHQPGMLPPGSEKLVMHAELRIGDTTILMSDGSGREGPKFEGFSLAITAGSEAEANKVFAALSDGGQVRMPLNKTFFSPRFGMCADRFGVSWMVMVMK